MLVLRGVVGLLGDGFILLSRVGFDAFFVKCKEFVKYENDSFSKWCVILSPRFGWEATV